MLIKYGAKVNVCSYKGYSPLSVASFHGYIVVLQVLLKNGADIDKADEQGMCPLHIAC